MKINRRVIDIYNKDFSELVNNLSNMSKSEREEIYIHHSRKVFPKSKEVVNLEDQISGRSDYIHKFKRSFFIIGNRFFQTNHLGDYHQEEFIRMTGYESQRYPQKVILALSMMGYINDMSCSYSVGHHGYQYEVDYWKFKKWGDDFFVDILFDEDKDITCLIPDYGEEWLYEKQTETLKSIRVDGDLYSLLMKEKDSLLGGSKSRKNFSNDELKKLKLINDIENLYHKTESGLRITVDGKNGRLYSIMTRMKSEFRHGGYFTINDETFREVDMSNSQPTLLGLRIKRKLQEENKEFHSLWLKHALLGDFYEWLVDITDLLKEDTVDTVIRKFEEVIYKNKNSKKKKVREKAKEDESVLNKVKNQTSSDPHVRLRPIMKHWIIKFLFGKQIVGCDDKDVKDIERRFLKKLCIYLKENEPYIYEEIMWFKKHPEPKRKNPNETASELARKLQEEEVRFIKLCLKNLDGHVRYLYTVHDCIGCLVSDVEKVKSVMERTAIEYYGEKLNLKIEPE